MTKPFVLEHDLLGASSSEETTNTEQTSPDSIHDLTAAMNSSMSDMCVHLVDHVYGYQHQQKNTDLMLAKSKQLPESLKTKIAQLCERRVRNKVQQEQIDRLQRQRFQLLLEWFEGLCVLIEKFKCGVELDRCLAFEPYFSGIIENMHLKLQCLFQEWMLRVYDEDVTEKLRDLRYVPDEFNVSVKFMFL